ncbi:MAG: hypothetical protein A3C84_00370 [Candidatus Ryanbacteria bacterium RIFCSPHIGHO2_02_FULL_48_12]|uniref:Serine protease n=1 Tax=Candidatus Ryanbacteria bacterium RIFCSPHIGHO2_01_FULL_48_27 TaxID=1802115 RepID=A0A1G2G6C3_9BACT|nr:MAG: hypothetical protein A2756_02455 [Candidatus Ryanbacteria bacterium RIFCSPHIGHO2_01_FULL_48_27]OGZ50469.1 MAG: hypothetical protein A3C84_00370 [Candidatus Ryanbacteria bacterium RIFCSPHIGHO2_02_FULL_48_12]
MVKKIIYIGGLVLLVGAASGVGFLAVQNKKQTAAFQNIQEKTVALEEKIANLEKTISSIDEAMQKITVPPKEIVRREYIREKSQEELLTEAVANVTPGVVSIVVSKDVPQLEVAYVNPFGDDPFYKDFDIKVPVYRQKGTTRQKIGAGTGFIVRADGYIVTNKHVAADETAYYTVLLTNGTQKTATVLYRDPLQDIAIIKIPGSGYTSVPLGDSSALKLGQSVIAIGNALGEYNNSVSVGIISGLDRSIDASGGGTTEHLSGIIQTDAAINPGNSGGPLVDLSGKAIGVNVATVTGSSNISFSIPANIVKDILAKQLK